MVEGELIAVSRQWSAVSETEAIDESKELLERDLARMLAYRNRVSLGSDG